jgi:hypothetical protein
MEDLPLAAGQYVVGLGLTQPWIRTLFNVEQAAILDVGPADVYQSGLAPKADRGVLVPRWKWESEDLPVTLKSRVAG